jgi:biotin carboxyl carrier protein
MKKQFETLVIDDCHYKTTLTKKFKKRKNYEPKNPKMVTAFIPGTIKDIYVSEGTEVNEKDKLLDLEAMKMVNSVIAPMAGKVKKVWVKMGESVTRDQLLVELE